MVNTRTGYRKRKARCSHKLFSAVLELCENEPQGLYNLDTKLGIRNQTKKYLEVMLKHGLLERIDGSRAIKYHTTLEGLHYVNSFHILEEFFEGEFD